MSVALTLTAIGRYIGAAESEPRPASQRKFRHANIAGMAIALGANPDNARRVAEQILDLVGTEPSGRSLFGKERGELPADVNQEIEQLGRLLLAGCSQKLAYPVGAWAVALAHEDVDGSHFQFVSAWIGRIAGNDEAASVFASYVRDNG